MKEMPYTHKNRLADVLALIQVLGMYKETYRSEEALKKEFQRPPYSANTWIEIGRAHPEFFRVRQIKGTEVSLIVRHAQEDCPPQSPEYGGRGDGVR